ncbi:DUF4349 domain-containing protein [Maribellus sp. CM-23]|uniref:DUF4349 domain-containing protein n=1 Tax=Maribellus sp. CM-23 TaxID=2781026 RepID=UPI001F20699D|nr:DUF4349 domain-containing protein [Maribellus sp. CM-23]MCE4562757.1 DUF4349 domain-containing protein [Maribellus sp. CM-23]
MKSIFAIIFLTVLLASCRQQPGGEASYALGEQYDDTMPMDRRDQFSPPPPPPPPVKEQEVVKKKIIKDGRLGIEVKDLESTKARVDTLVKIYEGYYDNERYNNTDRESSYDLKIRIPASNFDRFISEVEKGKGEIKYKEIDARDVTDQFIDLETRLQNKKNYLARYNELLAQAKTVKEILEIQEEIRGLEEEIESTTGRLKYLGDLVDYSTLNLTLSKRKDFKYNPTDRDNFGERLKQALSKGWFGFVDFILFVVNLWPFWMIVTLFVYGLIRLGKRKTKK